MLIYVGDKHKITGRRSASNNPAALAINDLLRPGLNCGILYGLEIWSGGTRLYVTHLSDAATTQVRIFMMNGQFSEFVLNIDIPKEFLREGVKT